MIRFVVYHFHPVSARLQFLVASSTLFLPTPLPRLAELLDKAPNSRHIAIHPSPLFIQFCNANGLPAEGITLEKGFRIWVDVPGGPVAVHLGRVNDLQAFPPPTTSNYRWLELPNSFELPPLERETMRRIYEWLME